MTYYFDKLFLFLLVNCCICEIYESYPLSIEAKRLSAKGSNIYGILNNESLFDEYLSTRLNYLTPEFSFHFSNMKNDVTEKERKLRSIFLLPSGEIYWRICISLIDMETGLDIDTTSKCGPMDIHELVIPHLFDCDNFQTPNGDDLTFKLKFEHFDHQGNLHGDDTLDLGFVYLERLFKGSGYVIDKNRNFQFSLPLSTSSSLSFPTTFETNEQINITINPNELFDIRYELIKNVVKDSLTNLRQLSSNKKENDKEIEVSLKKGIDDINEVEEVISDKVSSDEIEELTYKFLDHISSHLGNLPLCISTSDNIINITENDEDHIHMNQDDDDIDKKSRNKKDDDGNDFMRTAKILILGDSHSTIFSLGKNDAYERKKTLLHGYKSQFYDSNIPKFSNNQQTNETSKFNLTINNNHKIKHHVIKSCFESNYQTCTVIGATAYGLIKNHKKKSITQANVKFEKCIKKYNSIIGDENENKKIDYIGIMVGEVDMREDLWNKRNKTSFQHINDAINNLFLFISRIIETYNFNMNQILLIAVPQVCPENGLEAQPKKLISTMKYNMEIMSKCHLLGCYFIDPTDELFDYDQMKIKRYFRTQPVDDIHCNFQKLYYFYHKAIEKAVPALKWCGI